jgi:DNA-binding NarL/FixJ family response regulator
MSTPLRHLKSVEQSLEKQLKSIRHEIARLEKDTGREKAVKDHFKRLRSAGRKLAKAAQYDKAKLSDCVNSVSLPRDIPTATIIHHAKQACDTQAAHNRALRNREVIRLAKRGHTNTEIADQLKISTRTISRVITAAFRTP